MPVSPLSETEVRRKRAVRTAKIFAAIAALIYVGFIASAVLRA